MYYLDNNTKKQLRKMLYSLVISTIITVVCICVTIYFFSQEQKNGQNIWSTLFIISLIVDILLLLWCIALSDKSSRTIRYARRESSVLAEYTIDNYIKLNTYTFRVQDILYISIQDKALIYARGNNLSKINLEAVTQFGYTEKLLLIWTKDNFEPYNIEYHTYGPDGTTLIVDINLVNSMNNLLQPYIAQNYTNNITENKEDEYIKCPFCGVKNASTNVLCTQCGGKLD